MALENVRFFYINLWDSAVIESSSEATNFSDTNTQQRWKKKCWRATGDTAEYIRTAGSSALTVTGFFIFYHNVTAGGTVTVKGSNDNWGTTPLSQAMTRTADSFVYIPPAGITYDDFGFYVADPANPAGYVELGRIWIGAYYAPSPGYNPDITDSQVDPSVVIESTGGQVSYLERTKYKTWNMQFDGILMTNYDTFINQVGTSKEFVMLKKPKDHYLATYPTPELYSHYVHLTAHDEAPVAGAYYKASLKIQEER